MANYNDKIVIFFKWLGIFATIAGTTLLVIEKMRLWENTIVANYIIYIVIGISLLFSIILTLIEKKRKIQNTKHVSFVNKRNGRQDITYIENPTITINNKKTENNFN